MTLDEIVHQGSVIVMILSAIATARKLFLGDQWAATFLTQRDQQANTFDHLLTLDAPRTDTPELPKAAASRVMAAPGQPQLSTAAAGFQVMAAPAIPPVRSLDKPLSVYQQPLVEQAFAMEQELPPEQRRSGYTSPEQIKTEREASDYMRFVVNEVIGLKRRTSGR